MLFMIKNLCIISLSLTLTLILTLTFILRLYRFKFCRIFEIGYSTLLRNNGNVIIYFNYTYYCFKFLGKIYSLIK